MWILWILGQDGIRPECRRWPGSWARGPGRLSSGADLMNLTSHARRQVTAAAITCAVIAVPAGTTPASPAAARQGHTVTAYVLSGGTPSAVTPIRAATNRPLKPIAVAGHPFAIAITPDGKTVYVVS